MLAILYLLLSSFIGYQFMLRFFPALFQEDRTSLFGKPIRLPNWMITIPAAFLVGTLTTTWFTYLVTYLLRKLNNPLFYGDLITFIALLTLSAFFLMLRKEEWLQFYRKVKDGIMAKDVSPLKSFYMNHKVEIWVIVITLLLWGFFVFRSFYITGNDGLAHVGNSVYSDFGPHLAVVRSFSNGANYPTEYPHFPDGSIRYHFFFQFLSGNMEFLGLRLDWAFNLPSILGFLFFIMLLYSFTVTVTGERWVGVIAAVLFFFRSSFAFFTFITARHFTTLLQIINGILGNADHIGRTQAENWGMWGQKTFVNQRHFPFSLAVFMLILILLLPLFRKMFDALKEARQYPDGTRRFLKEFLFSVDAWVCEDIWRSVIIGIILGLNSFWNGSVVIGALPVLFILALCSKHRLEYANIAFIAVVFAFLEGQFFIGSGAFAGGTGAAFSFKWTIGFLAPDHTLKGILKYYIEVFGILPFVALIGALILPLRGWWLTLAFTTPVILATTVQLTPDVMVNHKYVEMSFILLNIIAANLIYRLYKWDFSFSTASIRNTATFDSKVMIDGSGVELANVDAGAFYPIKGWMRFNKDQELLSERMNADINYTVDFSRRVVPAVAKEETPKESQNLSSLKNVRLWAKVMAILMLFVMTITGVVDLVTLYNMDRQSYPFNTKDSITEWAKKNTKPDDIFLTYVDVHSPVLLAGRKIFYGWPYFAWSAGYQTDSRASVVSEIYNGFDPNRVKELLLSNKISYVVIDDSVRNGRDKNYQVNEQFFRNNFQIAFEDSSRNYVVFKAN